MLLFWTDSEANGGFEVVRVRRGDDAVEFLSVTDAPKQALQKFAEAEPLWRKNLELHQRTAIAGSDSILNARSRLGYT